MMLARGGEKGWGPSTQCPQTSHTVPICSEIAGAGSDSATKVEGSA